MRRVAPDRRDVEIRHVLETVFVVHLTGDPGFQKDDREADRALVGAALATQDGAVVPECALVLDFLAKFLRHLLHGSEMHASLELDVQILGGDTCEPTHFSYLPSLDRNREVARDLDGRD